MHSILKKIAITVCSFGIALSMFTSCSDDIVLEPLDSILGAYDGHFTLRDLNSGSLNDTLIDIDIEWSFREITYEMDDSTTLICSPSGDYLLNGAQINLDENFNGNSGGVCDPSKNPFGDFSIRRPGDSLILTQNNSEGFFIEIRLVKAQ